MKLGENNCLSKANDWFMSFSSLFTKDAAKTGTEMKKKSQVCTCVLIDLRNLFEKFSYIDSAICLSCARHCFLIFFFWWSIWSMEKQKKIALSVLQKIGIIKKKLLTEYAFVFVCDVTNAVTHTYRWSNTYMADMCSIAV